MNEQMKVAIREGRAVLFLGAGASYGSANSIAGSPPFSNELARILAEKMGLAYKAEPVSVVYSAALSEIGSNGVNSILESLYKNCSPSPAYEKIASLPWPRIYTTNIDDAFERALESKSPQRVNVTLVSDSLRDKDQLYGTVDYVYLNGSAKRLDKGVIFSPEEYGRATSEEPNWYREIASDYFQNTLIFIGTRLDEPAFYHHIERYKKRTNGKAPRSYLITPDASEIEKKSLLGYGVEVVDSDVSGFADWIVDSVGNITPKDIIKASRPEIASIIYGGNKTLMKDASVALGSLVKVSRSILDNKKKEHGVIRSFYKGFKPSWQDIIDEVPANLHSFDGFYKKVTGSRERLVSAVGPAGSGKSTLLKSCALRLSDEGKNVYYVYGVADSIKDVIRYLENSHDDDYFLFIDRFDHYKDDISDFSSILQNGVLVGAESLNVWGARIKSKIKPEDVCVFNVKEISESDVKPLLDKLEKFGPWTRLSRMTEAGRKREIFDRAKRQLLIGLMEATTGVGFEEIILRDYNSIEESIDRAFFVCTCIATMHRTELSFSIATRAIQNQGFSESVLTVASRLDGMIDSKGYGFSSRHPIYARKIVESIVDKELISSVISSLLSSFVGYAHPVVKNVSKNDAVLFKSVINHNFLIDVLRSDKDRVFSIYSAFEKFFESDGLYWLQYGLSKRYFEDHIGALELLQTAAHAYPHDHTIHALAQQKMILASSDHWPEPQARAQMTDAIDKLRGLDKTLKSDDTYPLVTLAEGHVKALEYMDGVDTARIKANEYVREIEQRLRRHPDSRLEVAKKKLFVFASTGAWKEDLES